MKRVKIAEGVFLTIIPSDKFKTNYLDFNLIVPLKAETASYAALLPSVLQRGTVNFPNMALLNKRLSYLYATALSPKLFKKGEAQIIGFSADFLRNSLVPDDTDMLSEVISILGEVIYEPYLENGTFSKAYVENEKINLIDLVKAQINNKNSYAIRRLQEEMCKDEDFGVCELGSIEKIEKITSEKLYAYYRNILETARIELFFTGVCENDSGEKELTKKIEKLFAGKKRGNIIPANTFVKKKSEEVREVVEEMPVNQGKLAIGFRTGQVLSDKKYSAFALFNELFGGSPTSRLFENVREKLSLCYYCRSIPDGHKGLLTVASGIEVENRKRAQDEILYQLECIKRGDFTEEDIISAKKSLINGYRELYDDASALSSWYLARVIAENYNSVEDVISEITKVEKDELKACANKLSLDTIYFLKGTVKNEGEGGEEK